MEFTAFWSTWLQLTHRSDAKKNAERAFTQALRQTTPDRILTRLHIIWDTEWCTRPSKYIPYAASWLRSEAWGEEPKMVDESHPLFDIVTNTHWCPCCKTPHEWECTLVDCYCSYELICPEARKELSYAN